MDKVQLLELFSDHAVFTITVQDSKILLPDYCRDVTILDPSFMIVPAKAERGKLVEIEGKRGRLVSDNGSEVKIESNSELICFRGVKQITYLKDEMILPGFVMWSWAPAQKNVIVRGVLDNLSWQPSYQLTLSGDKISSFSLLARIRNFGTELSANKTIFRLAKMKSADRGLPMLASQAPLNSADVDVPLNFDFNYPITYEEEISLSLTDSTNVAAIKSYFLTIDRSQTAILGYLIKVGEKLPGGTVTVLRIGSNLSSVGQFYTEGDRGYLKIEEEPRIMTASVVDYQEKVVTFQLKVFNQLPEKVKTIIALPVNGIATKVEPLGFSQKSGRIEWVVEIPPGALTFTGRVEF